MKLRAAGKQKFLDRFTNIGYLRVVMRIVLLLILGAVVQLGAHLTGSQKVAGSTPASSIFYLFLFLFFSSQGRIATFTALPSIIICSPSSNLSRGSSALIRGLAFTIPAASRDKAFSTVRGV